MDELEYYRSSYCQNTNLPQILSEETSQRINIRLILVRSLAKKGRKKNRKPNIGEREKLLTGCLRHSKLVMSEVRRTMVVCS